jgi:hypothetical protein
LVGKLAVVAVVLLQTLSLRADKSIPQKYDDAEAYRVYSALLLSRYFSKSPDSPKFVIETETTSPTTHFPTCFPNQSDLDLSDWQTLLDLKKEAQIPRVLKDHFKPTMRYWLVPRGQLDAEIIENGVLWAGFQRRYPDSPGIVSLSAVGFNERKDRALVYVSFVCGILCGGAHFYTLEKRDKGWQIIEPAASCMIYY